MRNVKYISMTWGLTHALKAMCDAKQPIISVHYFLKALTWVRSLYIFKGCDANLIEDERMIQITILSEIFLLHNV